jgi:Immunity protein 27
MDIIKLTEIRLTGAWIKDSAGKVVADEMTARIKWLIKDVLVKLATDFSGWDVLYRDPQDGCLWELTCPHSDWHGDGPPDLRHISLDEAASKYGKQVSAASE